jgi:hypothetical protein
MYNRLAAEDMNKNFSYVADTIRVESEVEPNDEVSSIAQSKRPASLPFPPM